MYDLEGRLVDARKVNAGETSIALPQGIYLVRIADRSYKVILR
ncbi:T9SS type A sorting domain-containing protein [Tannerella forsythia]